MPFLIHKSLSSYLYFFNKFRPRFVRKMIRLRKGLNILLVFYIFVEISDMFKVVAGVLYSLIWRFLVLAFVFVWVADWVIVQRTSDYFYFNVQNLPVNKTGLLLGTIKTLSSGQKNLYFYHRIDAAVQLFEAGKIENIVVSGDNHTAGYNEPEDMKNELIRRGVPPEKIYCDYAGFRTLDSVIRM